MWEDSSVSYENILFEGSPSIEPCTNRYCIYPKASDRYRIKSRPDCDVRETKSIYQLLHFGSFFKCTFARDRVTT